MVLWLFLWLRTGRLKRDLGVCAWTSLSICAKNNLEQQTCKHNVTTGFFAPIERRCGLSAGVGFPPATPPWNFPYRWFPQSPCCHCLLFEGWDVYGKQSQAGRALMRQHTEIVQGCADSGQEMETESDWVKQLPLHLAYSVHVLMMTR